MSGTPRRSRSRKPSIRDQMDLILDAKGFYLIAFDLNQLRWIYVRFPFDSLSIPVRFDLKKFDYV